MLDVSVEVINGSQVVAVVGVPPTPVNLSYRWLDESGKDRGRGRRPPYDLPAPLAPGRSARVGVTVALPTGPGCYTLVLTLVQERFAWLDDLDAGCSVRLPATVAVATLRRWGLSRAHPLRRPALWPGGGRRGRDLLPGVRHPAGCPGP